MTQKKKVVVTAADLQAQSDSAIAAFKSLIDGLKSTNAAADSAKIANEARIAALQAENLAIAELSEKNEKIVRNIENLLIV